MIAAFFAWLHFLAIGVAAGLLLAEYWLCRRMPDRTQARLLGTVDLGYQFALIVSLATGLARAIYYGQDVAYYLANRLFWLKIAIFAGHWCRGRRARRFNTSGGTGRRAAHRSFAPLTREFERVRGSIALGLGLWLILPLIAILVARGYGS